MNLHSAGVDLFARAQQPRHDRKKVHRAASDSDDINFGCHDASEDKRINPPYYPFWCSPLVYITFASTDLEDMPQQVEYPYGPRDIRRPRRLL